MRSSIDDYASTPMLDLWSPVERICLERGLWVLVMELQAAEGIDIPFEAIEDYRAAIRDVNLESIASRELVTRHDLRARLEEFNDLAGYGYAHWGLTSCDITDNATQVQIRRGVQLVWDTSHQVLELLKAHIEATRDTVCVARTHNLPAQPTLLGKRFASIADEFLSALTSIRALWEMQACRGLVGAVGTGQDLTTLLGSQQAYDRVNKVFIDTLAFNVRVGSVGQVYPRSEDAVLCSTLVGLLAAPANLARMIRLETGYGRMWEQFDDGQVGSSAMPHKRNSVISERVNGLHAVAQGFNAMVGATSGAQWFEGDVSDSVTRRIGLPGLFKAVDATLWATVELLQRLDLSKQAYAAEVVEEWDSINTGTLLTRGLLLGMDRDQIYKQLQTGQISDELKPLTLPWRPDLSGAKVQIEQVLEVIDHVLAESSP